MKQWSKSSRSGDKLKYKGGGGRRLHPGGASDLPGHSRYYRKRR